MPKISVIIPVYNVEKYLRECLDSVVNQTLKDIEIICVDDGSTDGSSAILDEYAAKDGRIKVIHKENGGYGSAINKGIDIANGAYIGIVESDDWIAENMYELLFSKAKNTEAEIVKGNYYYVNPETLTMTRNNCLQKIITQNEQIIFNVEPEIILVFASIWSCIYKKEWLLKNNIKMVEDVKPYEDQPFLAETLSKASKIVFEGCAEYYYRFMNENSTSATVKPSIINYLIQKSKIRDIFIKNNCYNKKVMEYYWKGAYLGAIDWFNKPNNKYKEEFYNSMKKLFAKSVEDGCEFLIFDDNQKKEFNDILNLSYCEYINRNIKRKRIKLKDIFSIKNEYKENIKRKVITLFGFKIKFREKILSQNNTQCIDENTSKRLFEIENKLDNINYLLRTDIDAAKIEKCRGLLRLQQLGSLSILKYLVEYIEQNSLNYWIDFGTLLGAVRHKGFIPWDDDIDISMPRKDYDKFLSIIGDFCGNMFHYSQGDIIRVSYKNSTAQVDIFPYDSGYSVELPQGNEYDEFTQTVEDIWQHLNSTHIIDWYNYKTCNTIPVCKQSYIRELCDTKLLKGREVPEHAFMFLAAHCFAWKRVLYEYDDIFPLKEISFEGLNYKCPNKLFLYLSKYFGDFMTLPECTYTHHPEITDKIQSEKNIKKLITLIKSNNAESLVEVCNETSDNLWNI